MHGGTGVVASLHVGVGEARVDADTLPMMISEEFGRLLRVLPGAFVVIGNGAGDDPGSTPLHHSGHDSDDAILPVGARCFAELARLCLPRAAPEGSAG